MKRLCAILLLCLNTAHAEFKDGNRLLADLQSSHVEDRVHAMGYIVGIADMGRGYINCMPENATAGQLRDMVRNYLENTPAERHFSADLIVNKVLKTVWPCSKKGSSL